MKADYAYLLDTNIVSALARRPQGPIAVRIAAVGATRVAISIVVACELRFGLAKIGATRLVHQVERILEHLPVLPLQSPVECHYAEIRHQLKRAGRPIGPNDLLIAAHARALGLTVVSANQDEFERVPGLCVENWLASPAGEALQ